MIKPSELGRYSLFGGLTQEQTDSIFNLMRYEYYDAGQDMIAEGEKNSRVIFIFSGRVAVIKSGLILTELKEGDTVGEMEVLDTMASAATVRAMESVEAASLSGGALYEIYRRDIKTFAIIVMNLARDMSRRLRKMDEWAGKQSPCREGS
ncbi:MAG: cyclic nucleotide-binding domain-containing protein [Treponema sp.]|jgi:CRP-like cAMP-binding protein|nr:cyclic nucleotide-binding domain-containing protein [Treponema sp.]